MHNYTKAVKLMQDQPAQMSALPLKGAPMKSWTVNEIRVSKFEHGWLFTWASHPESPCLATGPDYRSPAVFSLAPLDTFDVSLLVKTVFECRFAHKGLVSLHAACVEKDGQAVCFTGDSGVGKSTRAQAWVKVLGAEFISGDRPAIRLEEDSCTACGMPWDGKEQIFRNVERPLYVILDVRRAPFTRLRRLTADQAYRVLVRQCFIPMWDPDTAALAMANIRRLSHVVPVYRLFCGSDMEAAMETHRVLFKRPQEIQEELPDMKIKEGFTLRNVADEHMVMPTGENIDKFGGAVVLSDAAAFIFKQLQQSVSREDLLDLMLAEFDVDEVTAAADLDALLTQFRELEMLEE
ncbi:MAG: PqqD family peptide modification chaperone [Bacillota bacterium]|nr:PqqD family peptide modification chaperone [Bacillota bacterium]